MPSADLTSYSRLAGLLGTIVLVGLFGAMSNVILYKAFANISDISALLGLLCPYLISAAGLFAPYAFDQIARIFNVK